MNKSEDNTKGRNNVDKIELNESIIVNQQQDGSVNTINENLQKNPIVGKAAPFFTGKGVVDKEIKEITLSQFEGNYLLLIFMAEASLKKELE